MKHAKLHIDFTLIFALSMNYSLNKERRVRKKNKDANFFCEVSRILLMSLNKSFIDYCFSSFCSLDFV